MTGRPLDVLEETMNESVTVQLKDGERYVGTLAGYDQHMNLVLEPDAGGVAEPLDPPERSRRLIEDTTIIRGDNVVSINL